MAFCYSFFTISDFFFSISNQPFDSPRGFIQRRTERAQQRFTQHLPSTCPINVQIYFSLQIRSACRFLRFLFSSFLTAIPLRSVVFICVRMFKIITRFRSTENSVPIVHNGIRSTCRCISLYRSDQRADFSASFLRIFSPLFRCVP
jgi:hypothetical protein